ncbi:unnamed protein product [Danaus chrysippus]|uniref:(African queen) hypothetical protein n=1 Tax=Danaus chrysippus TaxID=151541 RepID=A0A8J2QGE8_9NEOP|nr:unnamed protein product [Danaus chrysippus]
MACKLHRVRYYNPKPVQINCVSFNKTSKRIALARQDASIEIWDLNYAPLLVQCISGTEDTSVEALGWVHDRLLSTGLGGALIEWDLESLRIKCSVMLTGYAAWCLDVNSANTVVAVGTEQGYINLYSVENNEIVYKKLFDKQEGRIMCCKFDKTGNTLVTGSVDTIRVWNVEMGYATCRISVNRRGKETIVWSLAVLSDNTVVSGDSHGRLTFWDGNLGDQIEAYTTHKADILSIVVSDDERSLYCSGVDPVITNFVKVNNSAGKQTCARWVKNVQRNIHEHDVRALILNGEKLLSVGADGYLTLSSYPPKWVMRIPPMIPAPRSSVSAHNKLLLLRYSNFLEIWKLGSYAVNKNGNVTVNSVNVEPSLNSSNNQLEQDSQFITQVGKHTQKQTLKLTEQPTRLVSIQTKGKKQIRCCEMSPSGELIVYSTDSDLRMLKLDCDDDQSNVSLTKVFINGLSYCERVAFTTDSRTLVAYRDGTVYILQVDPESGATVVQTLPCDQYLKMKSILHLVVSKDVSGDTYVIVSDTQGNIAVWVKNSSKFEYHASLPRYHCLPSAMSIEELSNILIIAYVDQKIIQYDLCRKKVIKNNFYDVTNLSERTWAITGVTSHPVRPATIFYDEISLAVVEKNLQNGSYEPTPKKKNKNDKKHRSKIIPFKYLVGFHWLGDDEAVSLEVLPENIISQLPPVLAMKRHS